VSLFADSGIRLNELLNIRPCDVDLEKMTVTVWGKGGKQREAPFTERSKRLLKEVIKDWESLDMVVRYTRSVRFEESLRVYRGMEK